MFPAFYFKPTIIMGVAGWYTTIYIYSIALLSVSDEIESNKQKAIELSNKLFQPEQLKEALKRGGLPEANRWVMYM